MQYIIALSLFIISVPSKALAHVRYVIEESDFAVNAGSDMVFLLSAVSETKNIFIFLGTIAFAALAVFLFLKVPFFVRLRKHITERADSYFEFIPWILRLSLGISLIGAGSAQVLVSPALASPTAVISFLEVLLGFLILVGLFVVPSAIAVMILYFLVIFTDFYLIGNIELLAGAFALLILDNERPGMDDLLGLPKLSPLKFLERFVPLILRVGVGGAMVFLAVYEKLLNPHASALVVDAFSLQSVIPVSQATWVLGTGVVELLVGLFIFFGIHTRLVTIIAFLVLSLSFFYFGEEVYSHITLFGLMSALFITRGGFLSFDHHFGMDNVLELREERLPPEKGII